MRVLELEGIREPVSSDGSSYMHIGCPLAEALRFIATVEALALASEEKSESKRTPGHNWSFLHLAPRGIWSLPAQSALLSPSFLLLRRRARPAVSGAAFLLQRTG